MGRRRSSILQDLFAIGSKLPWWATVLLALGIYALLHQYAASGPVVAANPQEALDAAVANALRQVAAYAQYILPWLLIAGMFTSIMRRASRAQLFTSVPDRQRARDLDDLSWAQFENVGHEQESHLEEMADPACPRCKGRMVRRTAQRGRNAGHDFWGCSRFPACHGTRGLDAEERYPLSA